MQLQQQIITLPQAKRLKELWVRQDNSAFIWNVWEEKTCDSSILFRCVRDIKALFNLQDLPTIKTPTTCAG